MFGQTEEIEARLGVYLAELSTWGARVNLVGSLEPEQLALHVHDSLAAAAELPTGSRVADLGSGAGLPGVPLAIARPDVSFALVEIRERRVHFLRHVVRKLGLGCRVVRQRLEQAPIDEAERFDRVTARAVGPIREVMGLASGWVRREGEIWIWTREHGDDVGVPGAGEIPIASDSARGHILRVPALAIPRGTVRSR